MLDVNKNEIKIGDTMIFEGKISRLDEETEQCFIKNESGTAGNWFYSKYLALKEPDMREKIKEYISELDAEINRCDKTLEDMLTEPEKETANQGQRDKIKCEAIKSRVNTLMEVKNDLQSRLENRCNIVTN